MTAPNGSVMTGPGTNTYFVGDPVTWGFSLWAHQVYQTSGGTGFRVLSTGFAAATVALAYYLINLRRFLGR